MNITLVSETWFPQINGVSRALGRLVEYLRGQGDRVQLVVPFYGDAEPDGLPETVSLKGFDLPFYRDIKLVLCRPSCLQKHLLRFKPDIVHIATEGPLGRSTLRAVKKTGYPLVTSYHTNFPDYLRYYKLGWLKSAAWKYLRCFHNSGSATLCPTLSIKEELEKHGFRNVEIWGRGVDCDRFTPDRRNEKMRSTLGLRQDEVAALYVGRVADEKNLDMLLEAARITADRRVAFRLCIVGDGPAKSRLVKNDGGATIFTGYKSGDELADIYAAADLFVFPSLTDTFGNVILEGMASGLPAIGFNAPGPRDIIREGETGKLVYERSATAFSTALVQLVEDKADRQKLAGNARRYALACQWNGINAIVRKQYQISAARNP